jgi:hypothetical protein
MKVLDRLAYSEQSQVRQPPPSKREREIIFRAYRQGGANAAIAALMDAGYEGRRLSWIRTFCSDNNVSGPRPGRQWRLPDPENKSQ